MLLLVNCSKVLHRDMEKPFGHGQFHSNGNLRSVSVERNDLSLSSEYFVNIFLMQAGAREFKALAASCI